MELTEPPSNPLSFAAGLDGEPAPHRRVMRIRRLGEWRKLVDTELVMSLRRALVLGGTDDSPNPTEIRSKVRGSI
jgi:hypothetical protein